MPEVFKLLIKGIYRGIYSSHGLRILHDSCQITLPYSMLLPHISLYAYSRVIPETPYCNPSTFSQFSLKTYVMDSNFDRLDKSIDTVVYTFITKLPVDVSFKRAFVIHYCSAIIC